MTAGGSSGLKNLGRDVLPHAVLDGEGLGLHLYGLLVYKPVLSERVRELVSGDALTRLNIGDIVTCTCVSGLL